MGRKTRTNQLPGSASSIIFAKVPPVSLLQKTTTHNPTVQQYHYKRQPQIQNTVRSGSRFHIGCGTRRLAGWINADAVPGVGDVVFDLHDEMPREVYREIYGSHVLEHCWPQDTPAILHRLHDALLPGGTLRLSVPDLRLVLTNCIDSHAYGDERSAMAVLYGGDFSKTTNAPDLHRQAFWKERLERLLHEAGFVNIREWNRGQYPEIDALKDYATWPCDLITGKSLISLNIEADRSGDLKKALLTAVPVVIGAMDVSIILGTVDRPQMLKDCVEAIRSSLKDSNFNYEIVVAYGRDNESSLDWMLLQSDIVPVLGGMDGAIEAFNRAYAASKGRFICQINDDVLVEGDSIAKAVQHLNTDFSSAGVVFKFDRGDGQGYRHERINGALHPNQIVVRRETCEAVVERIGGFWGDTAHRTDKTYGGDTAFGVMCQHLGLRLDSVEGVTCRDLLAQDALRENNKSSVAQDHGVKWRGMYTPVMSYVSITGSNEWPNLYIPRPGMPPRRSPIAAGRPLRVVHLSLKSEFEPQTELRQAIAAIGPTIEFAWSKFRNHFQSLFHQINNHKPDIVFAQIQSDIWTSAMTAMIRSAVGSNCTLILWTGDVRTSSTDSVERWQVKRGQDFDIILASNTSYPHHLKLYEKVAAACGYMTCGVEIPNSQILELEEKTDAGAVFLGTNYSSLDKGVREGLFSNLIATWPCPITIYGEGWKNPNFAGIARPFISKDAARSVMRTTPLTIVTSLFHDLGRYTSDRLARAASSGAVMLVREFVDMQGLGLKPGKNCLTWNTEAQLIDLLRVWSQPDKATERREIRDRAVDLARTMTWDRVIEELLAIVRDYRMRKGLT